VVPHEPLSPIGTRSFHSLWLEQRAAAEQTGIALIAWNELDASTVEWYGRKLGVISADEELHAAIRDQLLDGREFLRADEMRQVLLLFGRPELVRRLVNRPMIDCRAPLKDSTDKRFDRVEVNANLIAALRAATTFFAEHIGVGGATIENLTARSGSANYIAMREALVNLLIHQDYSNQKMAGQVIFENERATFINPGAALVSQTELIEGNVNHSRNPLLSRALKLIGFAELAGSGLGAIYDAWRGAKRRPPVVESSQERNTFRLTLDWRTLPTVVDKFWKETVGVSLSAVEAATVVLAAESKGTTLEAIVIAHGMRLDDVRAMVRKLTVNEMVAEADGKIVVHEKRREQVQQAKAQTELLSKMLSSPLS
jgi:predicted HTH transcriptional regulator